MHIARIGRTTAAMIGASAAALLAAGPALAAECVIRINPGNVPTTAAGAEQECGEKFGGGPYEGKDVWVFNLPEKDSRFLSITATFKAGDTTETVVIEEGAADGDDIVLQGHSKAYVITTAGWTLLDATAKVTEETDKFVLTHTCKAKTPAPAPSDKPSDKPSKPSGKPSASTPGAGPSATPTGGVESPSPAVSTTPVASTGSDESLPLTGAAVSGLVVVGLGLVGGGALLMTRRKRRFIA
ncbi:LPXTG cell wall anchor domain-containing protein [Actinoplanes sp. NEAU-A12]|uniref:LPXTG cell wall anchor domain-containing protein n=1 Tax=Actinoplanes sandaracinus TaxID=3045177 RepID=A0ABT6X151_9ACTN|nr:LPXTG cell wall anchor domain-containing protein [Actinoplanes sandaracinus]MDI6105714.1 LPXTG cell wall anchor domain-containing protein [Actinoplanes sandaracinus]